MKVSATEASRGFSDVLSRAAAGETIEIDRHGHVVAVIGPPAHSFRSGAFVLELVRRLPVADDRFADDVRSLGSVTVSPQHAWLS